jgi:hypothetical protein
MRDTEGTVFEVPSLFFRRVRTACFWTQSPMDARDEGVVDLY